VSEEYHEVSCTDEFCLYLFLSTQSQPKGGALIGSQRCDNRKLRFACFFQELLLSIHAFSVGLDKDRFPKIPGCENLEEFRDKICDSFVLIDIGQFGLLLHPPRLVPNLTSHRGCHLKTSVSLTLHRHLLALLSFVGLQVPLSFNKHDHEGYAIKIAKVEPVDASLLGPPLDNLK